MQTISNDGELVCITHTPGGIWPMISWVVELRIRPPDLTIGISALCILPLPGRMNPMLLPRQFLHTFHQ